LIESACKLAKQNNCEICLDLASYNVVEENIEFLKRIVKEYVDILFANEEEAKAFTGMDPEKALDNISDDVKIAIVKVGKKGSMIKCSDKIYNYGIIPAKAVDTTGAGDLYAAGFLYGYINGYEFDKCANIGAITSGHIVEVIGAKMSDKVWSEIKSQIDKV
jgi:sugar/nucleoside kinase (ribokinase family)